MALRKTFLLLAIGVLIIPQITFAAWWNPFTWFHASTPLTPPPISSTPQKVITLPVQQPVAVDKTAPVPKKTVVKAAPTPIASNPLPPSVPASTPPPNTTLCNGKHYTACPAGQDFVCPASGSAGYCQTPQQRIPSPVANTPTPPVWDACKNIEGIQSVVPSGMYGDGNGNCSPLPNANTGNVTSLPTPAPQLVPVVDFCNNIEGAQSYTPSGMTRDTDGNCIVPLAPTQTPTLMPNISAIKAADVENKIAAYLQTLDSQIAALNVEIAIQRSQTTTLKTPTCQKTSNGCVTTPIQPSYNVGISANSQILSQLAQRKTALNAIYVKVQNYGNGGVLPSTEDISFLASVGISW